jgi:hypothetical protein
MKTCIRTCSAVIGFRGGKRLGTSVAAVPPFGGWLGSFMTIDP